MIAAACRFTFARRTESGLQARPPIFKIFRQLLSCFHPILRRAALRNSLTSLKSMHYCSASKIGFAHAQNTQTTRALLAARAIAAGRNAFRAFRFGTKLAADAADQF